MRSSNLGSALSTFRCIFGGKKGPRDGGVRSRSFLGRRADSRARRELLSAADCFRAKRGDDFSNIQQVQKG